MLSDKEIQLAEAEARCAEQEAKIVVQNNNITKLEFDLLEAKNTIRQLADNKQTEQNITKKIILERDNAIAQKELMENEIKQYEANILDLQNKLTHSQSLLEEHSIANEQLSVQLDNLKDALDASFKTNELNQLTINSLRQFKRTMLQQHGVAQNL